MSSVGGPYFLAACRRCAGDKVGYPKEVIPWKVCLCLRIILFCAKIQTEQVRQALGATKRVYTYAVCNAHVAQRLTTQICETAFPSVLEWERILAQRFSHEKKQPQERAFRSVFRHPRKPCCLLTALPT